MAAQSEARYFKIGLFVVVGVILLLICLMLFGNFKNWRQPIYVETYFNESVQGLSVGSPVKYRGMTIGQVKDIDFLANQYDLSKIPDGKKYARYIYVLMAIEPDSFKGLKQQRVVNQIEQAVDDGLRVKLVFQDFTGNVYIEINFTNAAQNPVLPIVWHPENYYIPSTISTLTRFSETAQKILENLSKVNFNQFFEQAQQLVDSSKQLIVRLDNVTGRNQDTVNATMRNLQLSTQNLRQLSDNLKLNPSQILFDKPKPLDPGSL